ncbi:MAG TPA: hypothetical protein VN903_10505 [Polyangia bacterium]|nr:hypothetical protein [Polyangia bacterium]
MAQWGVPLLLVGFGSVLVALAVALLIDGSAWGLVIAWVLGTWGGTLVAWGLIAGWSRSVGACVVGSAFALAAVVVALACVPPGAWELAVLCAIAAALALFFGVYQVYFVLQERNRARNDPG